MSNAPLSPNNKGITDINERIERIHAYVQHFSYAPSILEGRLNPDELEKLAEIRSTAERLRREIDDLIQNYRNRPQSN